MMYNYIWSFIQIASNSILKGNIGNITYFDGSYVLEKAVGMENCFLKMPLRSQVHSYLIILICREQSTTVGAAKISWKFKNT